MLSSLCCSTNGIMTKGKDLAEAEKSVIIGLSEEKKNVQYVTERIGRSKTAIQNALSSSKSGSYSNRPGTKPKITKSQYRAIIRADSKGALTTREIHHTCNSSVTVRRIQQVLVNATHLKCKKILIGPTLSPKHKEERIKLAKDYSQWRTR